MNIVIAGAAGHIGSHLIRELPNNFPNAKFHLIDSFRSQRFCSIFDLPTDVDYEIYESDVRDLNLKDVITEDSIVINLAAITDAAGSFGNAKEVEENNFQVTQSIAEACKNFNAKLISISSTSVYGTQKLVVSEDCSEEELNPQSPYAETKLKEEGLLQAMSQSNELQHVTCRFGTIYGPSPGMRFHTAVNKFCWQANFRKPITVWKTAFNQKRPYLDLSDASRAISHIIENNIFDNNIYNVLTENLTVEDVINEIKIFFPDLEIQFVENEIMNQQSYEVCNKKFISTGFIFHGSIKQAIQNTFSQISCKIP